MRNREKNDVTNPRPLNCNTHSFPIAMPRRSCAFHLPSSISLGGSWSEPWMYDLAWNQLCGTVMGCTRPIMRERLSFYFGDGRLSIVVEICEVQEACWDPCIFHPSPVFAHLFNPLFSWFVETLVCDVANWGSLCLEAMGPFNEAKLQGHYSQRIIYVRNQEDWRPHNFGILSIFPRIESQSKPQRAWNAVDRYSGR